MSKSHLFYPKMPNYDLDDESFINKSLLNYSVAKKRKIRYQEKLQRMALLAKAKECRYPVAVDYDEFLSKPQHYYAEQLRKFVNQTPVPKMLRRMEKSILNFTNNERLIEKYPAIMTAYMQETHHEFNTIMKAFSVNRIIKPGPDDFVPPRCNFSFKRLGRTERYPSFLANREKLQRNLLLFLPFNRAILDYSNRYFPQHLFDLAEFRGAEIDLWDLKGKCNERIMDSVILIRNNWYTRIIEIVQKHYRRRTIPAKMWKRALSSAGMLINRQLTEMKMRTIQHMFKVLSDKRQIPILRIQYDCGAELAYNPDVNRIYTTLETLIDEVLKVGENFDPITKFFDVMTEKQFNNPLWHVEISSVYEIEAKQQLWNIINDVYENISLYMAAFQNKFSKLYSTATREELNRFFAEPTNAFEECQTKINELEVLLTEIRKLPAREFFDNATIEQSGAQIGLILAGSNLIDEVIDKLAVSHSLDNTAICDEFLNIREKALVQPMTTEELLENGEYMLWVKNKFMAELKERIQRSLRIMGDLVDKRELTPEQLELQITTISWPNRIKEFLEKNAANYEQFKFTFEEKLVKVKGELLEQISDLIPQLTVMNDMNDDDKLRENSLLLSKFLREIQLMKDKRDWINKEERLFKIEVSLYPHLDDIDGFVLNFYNLIRTCIKWFRHHDVWMDGPFEYLKPSVVADTTEEYQREFSRILKFYKKRIKDDKLRGSVCHFRGSLDDLDLSNHPVPIIICQRMLKLIKDFRVSIYMVSIMCNPSLQDRHWDEMSEIAGWDVTPDAGTSLRKLHNSGIVPLLEKFEIVSIGANKETELQVNLKSMIAEWDTIFFTLSKYKTTNITILSQLDDIQVILDDHIIKTMTMRGSAFVKPCEQEVFTWYNKLTRINDTLEQWGRVQSNWLYLLPIFSSKDIVAQMPEEGRMFNLVDNIYKRYMVGVQNEPRVIITAPAAGLLEAMVSANEMLENITDGVNRYLEKKRLFFPRFFFLSNAEMLEILSETKDPLRVQPHLNKCFEGINRLNFDDALVIHSMISVEKEEVPFLNQISTEAARGSVEKWLIQVQDEMLRAVKHQTLQSFVAHTKTKRTEWVLNWPGMVVLCVSQIFWAAQITECLMTGKIEKLQTYYEVLQRDLNNIVNLIRSKDISNLQRITIKALIVIDVHAKDVVAELLQKRVTNENDFNWLAQLRYYLEDEDNDQEVYVKIISASVRYANEYLGNSDRLVITPLTDRCYRTLMGAYQLHLNGAPEGPAGTGKTETTKDLAKALAVQCKVFNCSDGLDYKAMGKFFKGLASCGAWACFDEFNRIELEVLSVVAQQILSIIVAIRANQKRFVFEGTELNLNPACYVCITMNPGYAGRSELPDNLKVLFRTVAMMVPDYAMIGEISLYSYGYINARTLSVKIVTTYRLCSEQLSSQNHYDYGMRAVKTVLSACGNLKKTYPDEDEELLLLRSLIEVNLPKFLSFDVPLFEGIIQDLFPGVTLPAPDYELFTNEFEKVCKEMSLQPHSGFLTKVIQTYEMMKVRHGFILVGAPYAGKSSTLKVLAKCLSNLKSITKENQYYEDVEMAIVNPKSVSMNRLYGAFDLVSYEWTDGIASTLFRNFATNPSLNRKWLIFDGPVDAVWIENLNTVLDDNKTLCLTSGEVIRMSGEMSAIFEVMDLAQASPATVSRCGMIYLEPSTLGWKTFAQSWIDKCSSPWMRGHETLVMALLAWSLPPCIHFVQTNCTQHLYPGETKLLFSTLSIIEMQLDDACAESPAEEMEKYVVSWLQAALLFATVWGVGGILDATSRLKFDYFVKSLWRNEIEEHPFPFEIGKVEIIIPTESLLFDTVYFYKQKGFWRNWNDLVKTHKPSEGITVQVPTIDTYRYNFIIDMHVKHKRPCLLVGPTGTGKSFYTQNNLMRLNSDTHVPTFITLTTQITAEQVQELVISKLQKHRRELYGPPKGKYCVMFLDDMNMPVKEIYGAQPPLELFRQYFDQHMWYDLAEPALQINLFDILILAACGLVGGSRQDVYPRFLCHFNIFSINEFSDETMKRIFSTLLSASYRANGYGLEVNQATNQIVNATLATYKFVLDNLLPTPNKSHYVFNIRDIARVITGCSLMKKESVDNKKVFARLWIHEAMRVFFDRLVDDNDRHLVFGQLTETVGRTFGDRASDVLSDYLDSNGILDETKVASNLFFGSYFNLDVEFEDRKYEEVVDIESFKHLATNCLDEYNAVTRNKMNIVLFQYALMHLNRICRILTMPGGSALLVGVSGSGRQSLTRLAASLLQQTLFQPEINKNYGVIDWQEDLKKVLRESGGQGRDATFLFTDAQIKLDKFLQDIDCLLNLGEVPNIFQIDERQEILEMVRLAAQGGNRSIDISPLQIFQYFINRTKQKLHVILCFSPIGSAFRNYLRLYPSLVNCCTVNWFETWPEDALEMLAEHYMQDINVPKNVIHSVIEVCQQFHMDALELKRVFYEKTGRIIYVTSVSYLELINSFTKLMTKKQNEIMDHKMRYLSGLDKLQTAADAVAIMQKNLNELQPQLIELVENSKIMTRQIEVETEEAAIAREQVKKDEVIANVKAEQAAVLKAECEKDLEVALPILTKAEKELNTLKPADITLVKTMQKPSETVRLVMAAIVVMKGGKPLKTKDTRTDKVTYDYWPVAKKMIGEMTFLQSLKDFDKDNIDPEIMQTIRRDFIPHPKFQPKIVATASLACKGLCAWVIAMDKYDAIAKVVAPKKAKLVAAENEFAEVERVLRAKLQMAADLEARLLQLNENLTNALERMQQIEAEVNLCQGKLQRAESLIRGLGGEKHRWISAADNLQLLYNDLAGDVLLSCGAIAYLAPLNNQLRSKTLTNWLGKVKSAQIPCSQEFSLVQALGEDITIQEWNLCGLPRDNFSIENALINANSQRCGLFIDPQGQANKWIKQLERANQIRSVKFTQKDYIKTLEKCIELGYAALIENVVEDIDVSLDALLARKTFKMGGQECISLGDNIIPFHADFRLYFTSNLRNPHFLPEVFNKVTIINFALTPDGLKDQLLEIVVTKENPELQELKQKLVKEGAENKAQLKAIEDKILDILSSSKGDILEDETAIKVLDESKVLSEDIKVKQEKIKVTEVEIEQFKLNYVTVASRGSVLYYCITELPNIDPMYQFSLNWYINLYIQSIETAKKSKDLNKRLERLKITVTRNLYKNVCRSLFEKDKLLFSFILCTKVLINDHVLKPELMDFLLFNGKPNVSLPPKPNSSWISDKMWDDLNRLEQIPELDGLVKSFTSNTARWKLIYDHTDPHLQNLPEPWTGVNSFLKLLIIRTIRSDKTADAIRLYISRDLGDEFTLPPPFDIAQSYQDSNCLSPLIFILSPGADPMAALLLFAEKMGHQNNFQSISLGQGQGPIAQNLIEEAQNVGGWVCLQNCHLAASWLPQLEYIWESFNSSNINPYFRLWLTSYPSEKFPVALLQNCIKMTNEPPTGLQQNLLRSYRSEPLSDSSFYESCSSKEVAFTKLLFGICFFHAVVQERRKFGSLGWNIPYGFNESDFQISVQQLQLLISQFDEIPYTAITYLTGECNYGGRVTDSWDRRLNVTLLNDFVNPQIVENDSYKFIEGLLFGAPIQIEHNQVVKFIEETIPVMPTPEAYGLHPNAGIQMDLNTSNLLLSSLLSVNSSTGSSGDTNTEENLLSVVNEITNRLPDPFDLEITKKKFPVDYYQSMNTVLVQEIERFNKLLSEIKTTCHEIDKTFKGLLVMTPALEDTCNSMIAKKIPMRWLKKSYPSLKPLASYVSNFIERIEFLREWNNVGMPQSYWVSGFFFTQAFLTGAMQNYARKYRIPIDTLTFDFSVLKSKQVDKAPDEGVYIYGLFLEGARWLMEKSVLEEQLPKVLIETLPVIHLMPTLIVNLNEAGRYKCPVYKTQERRGVLSTTGHSTNYVLPILLPTNHSVSHWIKRSVAILCQTSD